MNELRRCPQCDAEIPNNSPIGLCPRCLLNVGADSQSAAIEPGPTKLTPPSTGFVPPTVEELAPLFPQLEILELLGKGGMGAVYKARQPGLDRLVAVKILPSEISHDPAFAERFQREARALARLSHPHIVAVYDFGETVASLSLSTPQSEALVRGANHDNSLFYIVMEFVDGANLRQAIQAGKLTPAEALAIVPQICEALQFAHDEGIVHRDIKPENILIDKRGRVKIADFGLAKLLGQDASDHSLTATHQVMGTLRYMAPEQMQGSREVDHRADIYSLGVVFYELLTGELPMGRFAPPSKRVQIDVRLDEIVLRALEQRPEQRYQHASELKSAVTSFSAVADRAHMTPGDQHLDQNRRLTTQVHKLLDVTDTRNRRLHHLVAAIGLVSLLIAFPMGLASLAKTLTGYRSILLCTCALVALAGIGLMAYSSRIKRRLCWKVNYKGHAIVFDGGRAFAERLYLDDGLVRQGGFGVKMEIRTTIKAGDGIGDEIVVWYDARILSCRCRIEVEENSWGKKTESGPVSLTAAAQKSALRDERTARAEPMGLPFEIAGSVHWGLFGEVHGKLRLGRNAVVVEFEVRSVFSAFRSGLKEVSIPFDDIESVNWDGWDLTLHTKTMKAVAEIPHSSQGQVAFDLSMTDLDVPGGISKSVEHFLACLPSRMVGKSASEARPLSSKGAATDAQLVQAPADCLLLAAGIAFVTACGVAIWLGVTASSGNHFTTSMIRGNLIGMSVALAIYSVFVAVAGLMLRRLRARLFVLLVAVIVGLFFPAVCALNVVMELRNIPVWPVVIPLWFGMPAALGVVVTLFRDDVRRAFDAAAEQRRLRDFSKPPQQTPSSADEPRFSRFAIAGAVWAIFGLLAVIPTLYFIGLNRVWNSAALPTDVIHSEPPLVFSIFMGALLAIGSGAPIGTTIYGAIAIRHIKRSGGKIIGLPLAVADVLFFPLLVLSGLIAALVAQVVFAIAPHPNAAAVTSAGAFGVLVALVVCFFVSRAVWQVIAGNRSSPDAAGGNAEPRLSRLAVIGLILVAIGTPIALFDLCAVVDVVVIPTALEQPIATKGPIHTFGHEIRDSIVFSLATLFVTAILSGFAINQIKRSDGKLYGLRLAVANMLVFPMFMLAALVAVPLGMLLVAMHAGLAGPLASAVIGILACFFAGRTVWRAILRHDKLAEERTESDSLLRVEQTSDTAPSEAVVAQESLPYLLGWLVRWLLQERWFVAILQTASILVYVVCLIAFFSFHSLNTQTPDGSLTKFEVGQPTAWLTLEASKSGQHVGFEFITMTHFVALIGLASLAVYRWLEQRRLGKPHSMNWHYFIWGMFLAGAVGFGMFTLSSRHNYSPNSTTSVSQTALPPLDTITNGIGVEFTVPAGQVVTFEIVTRRDNETVPVLSHCAYQMAPEDKPVTGQFRWTRIFEEASDSHRSRRWRIETLAAGGGGGHSDASLLPVELNEAVGKRLLSLGLLEPNEESIHWGTADVHNLPANGLIGLRVTVKAHGLQHGNGSGTGHIDWKRSQTMQSTSRRKLLETTP